MINIIIFFGNYLKQILNRVFKFTNILGLEYITFPWISENLIKWASNLLNSLACVSMLKHTFVVILKLMF
jgi:hypothetical protein